jgi:glycosyltransferase involved in cell wall biosynthesis
VIPCHNEAATIADVVRRVRRHLPKVVVVDDGSTDGTVGEAASAGARVIPMARRSGKGAALAEGWRALAASGLDWALMLDGDGQHRPEEASALLAAAGPARPLVIGHRLHAPGAFPVLRLATNRWMSRRLSRLAGCPLPDSQCGFRVARLDLLLALGLSTRHFEIESEMCVAFARRGHAIGFVEVTPAYGAERSKIRPLLDSLRWALWYGRTTRTLGFPGPTVPRPARITPPIPA